MRFIVFLLIILSTVGAQASVNCDINDYLKSADGKERLQALVERSKSLIISKLEDLGIEEEQIEIKTILPKSFEDKGSKLDIQIKSKTIKAEGAKISLSKVTKEEGCGMEVSIYSGHLLNQESGKNFGSLGRVKEFFRLK
jgi:hypothetical protein